MAAAAAGSSAAAAAAGSSAAAAASPAPITPLGDKAAAGGVDNGAAAEADCGVCAICLDRIALQDTALVKGCDHAYCVTCILRWASYKQSPSCPQCKHPFEFLSVHRSLDGCIHDYMFDESVCLLLRATWFEPLVVVAHEEVVLEDEEIYRSYQYDDGDEDDLYEEYISRSPSIRIGNRRWGDNGYVRGGRREARPVSTSLPDDAVPARTPKKKEASASGSGSASGSVSKDVVGRRAKRAQKREAADKAAAEKHLKHLQRLGRGKIPEVLPEALPEAPPEAKALPGALEVGPQAIE